MNLGIDCYHATRRLTMAMQRTVELGLISRVARGVTIPGLVMEHDRVEGFYISLGK